MATATAVTQVISISIALIAGGGIATLSLFDIPELQSQPASRSLPSIRWLFSRGSHIFPTASVVASAGFAYLAYAARPVASMPLTQLLRHGRVPGYLLAALLTFSIGPFTSLMVPTNFRLIKLNEDLGGTRSQKSAQDAGTSVGTKTAEDSVAGKDQANQFKDSGGPQEKTAKDSPESVDEEVKVLLGKFGRLNAGRAILLAAGGVVGLVTALG